MKKTLEYYLHQFTHLRIDKKGNVEAPHKPVLLLAIIHEFEQGRITNNRIYITPELVSNFRTLWNSLVETQHDARFALPFYHLRSSKFWRLIPNPGCEIWVQSAGAMRSISNLETAVAYAEIDLELAIYFNKIESREIFKEAILKRYFPNRSSYFFDEGSSNVSSQVNDFFEMSPSEYAKKITDLKHLLAEEAYQEEIFIRGAIFKREVPRIYDNTCCMSGLRIDSTSNVSMVDACHIVPFSVSFNDTISNGIALCPNLHRAFDRGLISIDVNFRVIVSKTFRETQSPYSLNILDGKQILLPNSPEKFPSIDSLTWHRENRFLG